MFWMPSVIYLYHGTESTCVSSNYADKPCSLFYRCGQKTLRMPRSLTNVGAGNTVSSRLNAISAVVVFDRRRPVVRCWHFVNGYMGNCLVFFPGRQHFPWDNNLLVRSIDCLETDWRAGTFVRDIHARQHGSDSTETRRWTLYSQRSWGDQRRPLNAAAD